MGIVVTVTVLGSAAWVAAATSSRPAPVDVVEAYFTAIVNRDVDGALALISRTSPIPVGERAAFLHPDAISDGWSLHSVRQVSSDEWQARVEVTISGPDGHTEAELRVDRSGDGPWRLDAPLIEVSLSPSPLAYVHINERVVSLGASNPLLPARFYLFPGLYRFYPTLSHYSTLFEGSGPTLDPRTVLPGDPDLQPADQVLTTSPAQMSATDALVDAVAHELALVIDDCARFDTWRPYRCPFATHYYVDTPDGNRFRYPEALEWTVDEYPEISLVDARAERRPGGFTVVQDTAGQVLLSGSGEDDAGEYRDFRVECDISFGPEQYASVNVDGGVTLTDYRLGSPVTCPHEE